MITAEAELAKERETNRLKLAKLENTIERMREELNLKCSEITHLTYRCEQSEQQIQADTPFTGEESSLRTGVFYYIGTQWPDCTDE